MNWIDIAIVLIVVIGASAGVRRGFMRGALDVLVVVFGLLVGALGYRYVAQLIESVADRSGVVVNIIAFAALALVVQGILSGLLAAVASPAIAVARAVPPVRWLDGLLGILPGVVKGALVATLVVLVVSLLPLSARADTAFGSSRFAPDLLARVARFSFWAEHRVGLRLADFTVVTAPAAEGGQQLPFTITEGLTVSEADEQKMLELVNQSRRQHGLAPLTFDPELGSVARAHSREMFELGYFAHQSPVTGAPGDRLHAAGIAFGVAGENLAYAPTVEIAHRGLMQSPGHRANILSPDFQRVGIGVVAAPNGGKMFTQEFAGD